MDLNLLQAVAIINEAKAYGYYDGMPEHEDQKLEAANGLVKSARQALSAGYKADAVLTILAIADGERATDDAPPWEGPNELPTAVVPAAPVAAPVPAAHEVDVVPVEPVVEAEAESTPEQDHPAEYNRQCVATGCDVANPYAFTSQEECAACGEETKLAVAAVAIVPGTEGAVVHPHPTIAYVDSSFLDPVEKPKRTRRVRHPETGELMTKEERDAQLAVVVHEVVAEPVHVPLEASELKQVGVGASLGDAQQSAPVEPAVRGEEGRDPSGQDDGEVGDPKPERSVAVAETPQEDRDGAGAGDGVKDAEGQPEPVSFQVSVHLSDRSEVEAVMAITSYNDAIDQRIQAKGLPIPGEVQGQPVQLPADFTTISDEEVRRFHSVYHQYLSATTWMLAGEENDLDASSRMADARMDGLLLALKADSKSAVTMLKAEASSDPVLAQWKERVAKHTATVRKLKVLRDYYEASCTRLSREWSMRSGELGSAGGRGVR